MVEKGYKGVNGIIGTSTCDMRDVPIGQGQGSFVQIKYNTYWVLIKPPLLICTRESDPDAG